MKTTEALAHYERCLTLESSCVSCQYEIGWTHWSRSDWPACVAAWEATLTLDPEHNAAATWLPNARNHGAGVSKTLSATGLRVPIGTTSRPSSGPVSLTLVARWQNYNARPSAPADHHDDGVHSPKSARFSPDGSRVYVNSLEGFHTLVFDPVALERVAQIPHVFDASDGDLFHGETTVYGYAYNRRSPSGDPNQFSGKPVESEISHGRYLWVPYYRRDFDRGATSPSAVAIVDLASNEILRVMPTGPIPKYVAASSDGNWVVVSHWGDNTLGVIDTSSGDPSTFTYLDERLVVESVLSQSGLAGTNRDSSCGFCLRGTVFTPDNKTLLVARMGGGGIAGFDVASWTYLGTLSGERPTPRHLVTSPDGQWLFFTSNKSGYVTKISLATAVEKLRDAKGETLEIDDWKSVHVGSGARTLEISPDGRHLFVALNGRAEVAVVDAETLEVVSRVRTDSYAVGLALSPDGKQLWTTSQGRSNKGGNSVCVFSVAYPEIQ
jgi:DNA-binding beta-propeller fold protein YncE